MGKRSNFKRKKADSYHTWDERAVKPLAKHLDPRCRYIEPCAGNGDLLRLLSQLTEAKCVLAFDKYKAKNYNVPYKVVAQNPQRKRDALTLDDRDIKRTKANAIITNPPWTREIMHAMIEHFCSLGVEVWLLFDADWLYTEQSSYYVSHYLMEVVPVGRVKWVRNSKYDAMDSVAWYRFSGNKRSSVHRVIFHPRQQHSATYYTK